MSKKKQSRKEKRVLAAALLVAGVITAGSTFAWFTSKDEVTNRLSASAKYDVSIAEDFQPPEDWIPGQTINKDVSAVNTGNVDAFVRMWLEGEMSVMKKLAVGDSTGIPAAITAKLGFDDVETGDAMYALGFLFKGDDNYYRVLSKTERANAQLNGTDAVVDDNTYSEVKSVQAGGYLVSAPENAQWYYIAEQQTEVVNKLDQKAIVAKDGVIGSKQYAGTADSLLNVTENCAIDSDTFIPVTPGLYIFRRNIALGEANAVDTYEYSGYVFDGTNYFALCNDTAGNSDYTLPDGAVTVNASTEPQAEPLTYTIDTTKIKLYTATETVVKNADLTWTADSATAPTKLTATYNGGTTDTAADDIVIDIALANIDNTTHTGQTWTYVPSSGTGKMATFYYNDDVEAGDSTAKLVDSVTLSSDTKNEAFLAFDFDLNVFLESVQITLDDAGQELTTPVESDTTGEFSGTSGNASPAYASAQTAAEIADIEWNAIN